MKTVVEKVDSSNPELEILKRARDILLLGGLVAFPTETVYGLGANGLDANACKKIYEAKGRPSDNPLILHISKLSELLPLVKEISAEAEKIMEAFWPGPITLVFKKEDCVPNEITGGLDTVAIRFPKHKVAQELIGLAGVPIAAPSANSSGKPSPTKASHVLFDLDGKIDMIVDGGHSEVGLESTILDMSMENPVLLRPGAITKEMIEQIVGSIDIDPTILSKPIKDIAPKAPGMKYKHYSPKADVILVCGDTMQEVVKKINLLADKRISEGKKVGILATNNSKDLYVNGTVISLGDDDNLEMIGANLFKMLRKFDFIGMDIVYSQVFSEVGEGMAIMNRLNKAAGYNII